MPLIGFILLYKNWNKEDSRVRSYFLILYQGLTPESFYWEFVNTLRKSLVLACLLLPETARIALGAGILFISGRAQMYLKPYKRNDNNRVEFLAIMAGTVTILTGLVFIEPKSIQALNRLTLSIVVMINAYFIINWVYLLAKEFEEKRKIARIVSCND